LQRVEGEGGGAPLKSAVTRVAAAARRYLGAVWSRDRATLGGWASFSTRVARVVTWSIRGVLMHRLSVQAAALAYYTIFSIVPVLVVALWILKLFDLIPALMPELRKEEMSSPGTATRGELLREAVRAILAAVDRAGRFETGMVGLLALLYGVFRQVLHVEEALDIIAGARERPPRYLRMLGYLALLALAPALLIVSGLLHHLSKIPIGETFAHAISWLLAAVPLLKSAGGVLVGLTVLCLALAIFYASAARARIPPLSALVGGALGAVLLAVVLWAFTRLQIGASHVGAVASGVAVVPVLLLWSYASWLVILLGAQVAVAHELDEILVHGARALRLDPYGEQVAGVQIMVESTRRAMSMGDGAATAHELARRLRLLPESVRELAGRLLTAGLLRRNAAGAYRLACDPERTGLRDIVGAIICRPDGDSFKGRERSGPTLHELVERETARPE
jgi:membrane protein